MAGGKHGGGSWKIAYADFITSMFALFLVLWIVAQDNEIRQNVEDYFQGRLPGKGHTSLLSQNQKKFAMQPQDRPSNDIKSINDHNRALEQIRDQLNNSPEMGEDVLKFEFMADGLRITALDKSAKPFFEPGTSEMTEFGQWVMKTIAYQIERFPMDVEVEGHTQKSEKSDPTTLAGRKKDMKDWDLSSGRASSAQQALVAGGVKPDQFYRVAGYADRIPMNAEDPANEENRRISIIVRPKKEDDVGAIQDKFRTK